MVWITSRVPRIRQPEGPAQLDLSNPLTRGIKAVFNPVGFVPASGTGQGRIDAAFLNNGTFDRSVGPFGVVVSGVAGGMRYVVGEPFDWNATNIGSTVLAFVQVGTLGSAFNAAVSCTPGSDGATPWVGLSDANNFVVSNSNLNATIAAASSGQAAVLVGTWFFNGSDQTLEGWINGTKTVSTTSSNLGSVSSSQLTVMDYKVGFNIPWRHGIYLAVAWNRRLTDAEITKIGRNPWQIFTPEIRRAFKAGAVDFVVKPLSLRVLLAKIPVWLERASHGAAA